MSQENALAAGLHQVRDIKILLDSTLCVHIESGKTKVMTMLPADYKPILMQVYGDGVLLHESLPRKGVVTVNRLTAS